MRLNYYGYLDVSFGAIPSLSFLFIFEHMHTWSFSVSHLIRQLSSFEILRFEMSFDFMCYLFCGLALGDKRWRDFICIWQRMRHSLSLEGCCVAHRPTKRATEMQARDREKKEWASGGVQIAFDDLKSHPIILSHLLFFPSHSLLTSTPSEWMDEWKAFMSPIFHATINSRKINFDYSLFWLLAKSLHFGKRPEKLKVHDIERHRNTERQCTLGDGKTH